MPRHLNIPDIIDRENVLKYQNQRMFFLTTKFNREMEIKL
jgi:hypothetical protein